MIDISYTSKVKPAKTLLYLVLGIIFGLALLTYKSTFTSRYERPDFQYKLVGAAIENKPLMNQIGGYNAHKFSYSPSGPDRDSVRFELLIYGGSSLLTYSGWAYQTTSREWQIKRIDSKVSAY
ncbi:hypothetical protein [Spirosoma sp. KNUC1025]|uniref:hypothetical protein n=1 Tax=Spirosoma sp. KNUC1025 TaxID=2894082 RepID=UPI0038677A94|nr:hypothetical protein LN737_20290 [Spirosoma sp. KNUC1025]